MEQINTSLEFSKALERICKSLEIQQQLHQQQIAQYFDSQQQLIQSIAQSNVQFISELQKFREQLNEFDECWKSQADSTGDDEDEDVTVIYDGSGKSYSHDDSDNDCNCDDSDLAPADSKSTSELGKDATMEEQLKFVNHNSDVVVYEVQNDAPELFDKSSKKEEIKVEVNEVHDSFYAMELEENFLRGIYAYGLEKSSVVKMFDPSHDWGGVDHAASALVKTDVEPILEQYRPMRSSMKFYKRTLGTIDMMKMEMQRDGTRVSVALSVQVNNIGNRPQICNLYVFDFNDLMWSVVSVTGDILSPRVGVTMASIGDIYVVGGRDSTYKELNALYSFNMCTSKWTLLSSGDTGPAHRSYHSITSDVHSITFDDRNVYILGGDGNNGNNGWLNDIWAYDTVDENWLKFPVPGEICKGRGGPGLAVAQGIG